MKFVIFHGSYGSPEGNWFPELKSKLEALDQKVLVPQFPVDDWDGVNKLGEDGIKDYTPKQTLQNWMRKFKNDVLPRINRDEKICFIGHSMGPQFILHVVDEYNIKLDSAIFVSPFISHEWGEWWQFELVNKTFYKENFDWKKMKKLIPVSYVIYSKDDPYVEEKYPIKFANYLNSSVIPVKRAGHLNAEVNLNEFPLVLELCKTRLDLTLYQKYLAHRQDLYGIDYINPSEEVVYLDHKEIFDEGIFKFRNLKKGGFCTLLTSMKIWDSESKYMKECRRAAKRTGNVTRVYIVSDKKDLDRKNLLKQITADLKSDVNVYFVNESKLDNDLRMKDFGIWDDEYLCTVDKDKVKLSSRKKDIVKGNQIREKILAKSKKVETINDFLKSFQA